MAAVVRLKDVWRMLDACAPGHIRRVSDHYWIVSWNGKSYRSLPKGAHGRRDNPEIETGHVRALIRHLGISAQCAAKYVSLD